MAHDYRLYQPNSFVSLTLTFNARSQMHTPYPYRMDKFKIDSCYWAPVLMVKHQQLVSIIYYTLNNYGWMIVYAKYEWLVVNVILFISLSLSVLTLGYASVTLWGVSMHIAFSAQLNHFDRIQNENESSWTLTWRWYPSHISSLIIDVPSKVYSLTSSGHIEYYSVNISESGRRYYLCLCNECNEFCSG